MVSTPENNNSADPSHPDATREREAQRQQLAELLGRLMARHWLRKRNRSPTETPGSNRLPISASETSP
jgi:hypothetical protein